MASWRGGDSLEGSGFQIKWTGGAGVLRPALYNFTQSQLVARLALWACVKITDHGIVDQLGAPQELRSQLGLKNPPRNSTLKYVAGRVFALPIGTLLLGLSQSLVADNEQVAIGSMGLGATSSGSHFQERSGGKQKKCVKRLACILYTSLIPIGVVLGWRPCSDNLGAHTLLVKNHAVIQPKKLCANADYEAEWRHEYCREKWMDNSCISPAVYMQGGVVGGKRLSQMPPIRLKRNHHSRRNTVESFMIALKRTAGRCFWRGSPGHCLRKLPFECLSKPLSVNLNGIKASIFGKAGSILESVSKTLGKLDEGQKITGLKLYRPEKKEALKQA